MDLTRVFEKQLSDRTITFQATYDLQSHGFNITEDNQISYELRFNPAERSWSVSGEYQPSIPVEELAKLVQESFGHFV
ncbi:hypothetical protein [Sphingobacterium sp. BN32]|uniref:hypothetical protein n=1 Tax=Sphingobacterium sp. BN32 TaxID=3058432 RepID=UPI00265CC896|nr:hypothetical protein [Sphingobacterium sp. BN32]WKK58280.1 hypothetical protein QYC40_16745 [Sphingobacterium sp. BN32]